MAKKKKRKKVKSVFWKIKVNNFVVKVEAEYDYDDNLTEIFFEGGGCKQSFVVVGIWDRQKITRVFKALISKDLLDQASYLFEDLLKGNNVADT